MNKYRLIVIDLDGTLCETHYDIAYSINLSAKELGIPAKLDLDVRYNVGRGAKVLIERLYSEYSNVIREQMLQLFIKNYSENPCIKSKLYPDVYETLRDLCTAKFILICLTNKSESISKTLLRILGVDKFFYEIIGGDTFRNKKPNPEAIYYMTDKYQITTQEILIVGDTAVDIETAKNAGSKSCAVTYGYNKENELSGSDYLIDSFGELSRIIKC